MIEMKVSLTVILENYNFLTFIRMLASGSDPLKKDIDGLTPCHYAAIAGNVETFGELPKACHSMVDDVGCRMPIHYAAICGKMDILDMLISYASKF